jgi:hypothetical protein
VPLIDLTMPLQSSPAEDAWGGQAKLVNCYAVPLERGKSEVVIHATDGLAPLATITGAGGIRAMAAVTEAEGLVVAGRVVERIDTSGTATLVGALPSDGHVGIAQNADGEVALVCDGLYYSYVSGVLTQLADPDLPPPLSVCSLKGYFVYMLSDGRMFASDLNDFAVEGLSYAQNEQAPDGGVVAWVRGNDLLGGGKRSIEVWQINPSAEAGTFPFSPVTTIIEPATQQTIGVLSADSAIEAPSPSARLRSTERLLTILHRARSARRGGAAGDTRSMRSLGHRGRGSITPPRKPGTSRKAMASTAGASRRSWTSAAR